jgi:hypothetical protein
MLLKNLPLVSGLLMPAAAETILGVTVFSRHGDRSSKHYKGYSLSAKGSQQVFSVGSDYRERYISSNSSSQILGISENKVVQSQIFASAPDTEVLLNTANSFLQGLYPPTKEASEILTNSKEVSNPLDGYQYVVIHSKETDAPDTIWLKGDENCPAAIASQDSYKESEEFKQLEKSTKSFYAKFYDMLKDVYDYSPEDMSYANAYDIFDLIHTGLIHNGTDSPTSDIGHADMVQLQTLADKAEFGLSYNGSESARSTGGRTFAGAVLNQLNQTITSKGKLKFSLMTGSYDTFLAFFGISRLIDVSGDFYGLPDYASTMSFELFTPKDVDAFPSNTDDLRVRFQFRNGSSEDSSLRTFPLFGHTDESMSWSDFVSSMKEIAITSPQEWCNHCQSNLLFCAAYGSESAATSKKSGSGMNNANAGVIGAMVTLVVCALIGGVVFFVLRRRRNNATHVTESNVVVGEKGSFRSSVDSGNTHDSGSHRV